MDWTDGIIWVVAGVVIGTWLLLKRRGLAAPDAAHRHLSAGAPLIDVRTAGEFTGQHLPGALNIPLGEEREEVPRRFPDRSTALVLHCRSGTRSAIAAARLRKLGYQTVLNLGSYGRAQQIVSGKK